MNLTNISDAVPYGNEVKIVLEQSGFGNHILAFLVFFGFLIAARVFIFVYERYLLKFAEETKTGIDDRIIRGMRKPVFFGLLFLGMYFGIKIIEFPGSLEVYANKVLISIVALFFAYFGMKFVDFIISSWLINVVKRTKSKLDDVIFPLIHKIVGVLFFIIAVLFILSLWGVKIGPFLASLGIAGLAIGFALKDSLANIFGGLSLIMDRTFKVGDFVELDKNTKGRIVDIGLRSTKIRTVDNYVIVVPNGDLSNKKVINYAKLGPGTRIVIPVNVEYGADVGKVKKVLLDCVDMVDKEIRDAEKVAKVYLADLGEFGMQFKLIVPITNYKKRFVNAERLRVKVYENLRKYGIKIAYPTYVVRKG